MHHRIATGYLHTCVIIGNDETGRVKCWGDNVYGMLGYGDTLHRGGESGQMGDDLPFVNLGTGRTAKSLAIASVHSCALLDNDKVSTKRQIPTR